jgi:hypothetical protein
MNEEQENENEPEAEQAQAGYEQAAGDAEAEAPPVRPHQVTITTRGWFNRRPPNRGK